MSSGLIEQIRVGSRTYTVETDFSGRSTDDDFCGATYNNRFLIVLDGLLPENVQTETLLHEVLHAATSCVGLDADLANPDQHVSEEKVITCLTPVLLGVLRDNPDLVKTLLA